MKVLMIHGVGHCENTPGYYGAWVNAIQSGLVAAGAKPDSLEFRGLEFDGIFDSYPHGAWTYVEALAELLAAPVLHPSRDFDVRWSAGMVAQLCVEDDLRRDLRNLLCHAIEQEQPDLIAAHSLGSLIAYDFLHNDPRGASVAKDATLLTFGSQINNVFAHAKLFPGPCAVPNVKFWYHLFNHQDHVLTASIDINDPSFLQVLTPSPAGHDPVGTPQQPGYLTHRNTAASVWTALATDRGARQFTRTLAATRKLTAKPRRRALLIGINDYPDPANRLEGCVNDTFLVSALLQERGFDPEDIRVVLNERATATGIRERLQWLLEGAGDGMERVLFYSGHGAQMPGYNPAETVDHVDECLVPYDFAWTKDTAITDDDLFGLYANLPFGARFFAMFDCCHAGGIHRDGGPRVRGLMPPDDIRHRLLRWDATLQMWRARKLAPINDAFGGDNATQTQFMGTNRATYRLGRGMRGRTLSERIYKKLPPDQRGPYLPVIIEACQEAKLSYEYRDGVTSYGAFTYSFVKALRQKPASTFLQVVTHAAETLTALDYQQQPQLIGPGAIVRKRIPGTLR